MGAYSGYDGLFNGDRDVSSLLKSFKAPAVRPVAVRMVYVRARDGESLPLSDNFRARLAAAGGASPG